MRSLCVLRVLSHSPLEQHCFFQTRGKETLPSCLPAIQVPRKKVCLIVSDRNLEQGVHSLTGPAWLLTGAKIQHLILNKMGGGAAKKREAGGYIQFAQTYVLQLNFSLVI